MGDRVVVATAAVGAGGSTTMERADSYDREDGTPFKRKRLAVSPSPDPALLGMVGME
jgi:hypothetical protein